MEACFRYRSPCALPVQDTHTKVEITVAASSKRTFKSFSWRISRKDQISVPDFDFATQVLDAYPHLSPLCELAAHVRSRREYVLSLDGQDGKPRLSLSARVLHTVFQQFVLLFTALHPSTLKIALPCDACESKKPSNKTEACMPHGAPHFVKLGSVHPVLASQCFASEHHLHALLPDLESATRSKATTTAKPSHVNLVFSSLYQYNIRCIALDVVLEREV